MKISKSNLLLTLISLSAVGLAVYWVILYQTSTRNMTELEAQALKKRTQLVAIIFSVVVAFGFLLFIQSRRNTLLQSQTIIEGVSDQPGVSEQPDISEEPGGASTSQQKNKIQIETERFLTRTRDYFNALNNPSELAKMTDDKLKLDLAAYKGFQFLSSTQYDIVNDEDKTLIPDVISKIVDVLEERRLTSSIPYKIGEQFKSIGEKFQKTKVNAKIPSTVPQNTKPAKRQGTIDDKIESINFYPDTTFDEKGNVYSPSICYKLYESNVDNTTTINQSDQLGDIAVRYEQPDIDQLAFVNNFEVLRIQPFEKYKTDNIENTNICNTPDKALYACNGTTNYKGDGIVPKTNLWYLGCDTGEKTNTGGKVIKILKRKKQPPTQMQTR